MRSNTRKGQSREQRRRHRARAARSGPPARRHGTATIGEASMAHIIAIANQKGGTAKTTTAVNFATGLTNAGYSVLLVDCDPQANATTSVFDRDKLSTTPAEVVCARWDHSNPAKPARLPFQAIEAALHETEMVNLDLVPASLGLAQFDREPATVIDRLVEAVREVSREYDFVILDTPPNLGLLFTVALKAASHGIFLLRRSIFRSRASAIFSSRSRSSSPAAGCRSLARSSLSSITRTCRARLKRRSRAIPSSGRSRSRPYVAMINMAGRTARRG
jgi:Mrp family chromosome partitioning ATPase